jgi:hypothetical protein
VGDHHERHDQVLPRAQDGPEHLGRSAARGADFRELERKDTDAELARFETMVAKALQPLVDDGVIANLKTERGRDQAGRPVVNWIATDVQSGAPLAGAEVLPWGA